MLQETWNTLALTATSSLLYCLPEYSSFLLLAFKPGIIYIMS